MPYKSKAERKRADYVTFVEAVAHICAVDRCDKDAAMEELLSAIIDNEVDVIWADRQDELGPPAGSKSLRQRWVRAAFWRKERILLKNGGMALNDGINTPEKVRKEAIRAGVIEYRPVVVKYADILRHWPKQRTESISRLGTGHRPPSSKATSTGGRPTIKHLVWGTLSLMRDEEYSLNRTQMALAAEIVKRNGKQFGDTGWSERTVLKHVSDWLDENGFSPARNTNQRK